MTCPSSRTGSASCWASSGRPTRSSSSSAPTRSPPRSACGRWSRSLSSTSGWRPSCYRELIARIGRGAIKRRNAWIGGLVVAIGLAGVAVWQSYVADGHAGCTHAYVVHRQLQSENCPRTIIAVGLVMRIRVARSIGDCFLLGTAQEPVNWALTCSSPNDNQFRQNCPGKWQATTCPSF